MNQPAPHGGWTASCSLKTNHLSQNREESNYEKFVRNGEGLYPRRHVTGLGLIGWMAAELDWANPWRYPVDGSGGSGANLKVRGPYEKTITHRRFVYGLRSSLMEQRCRPSDRHFHPAEWILAQKPVVHPGVQHRKSRYCSISGLQLFETACPCREPLT